MALKLPRLPTNWDIQPELFRRYWDEFAKQIESILNDILVLPTIQEELAAVETAVDTAQTTADGAVASVDSNAIAINALKAEMSIALSYPSAYTAPLISVSSTGVVTIAGHTRVYGDPVLNPNKVITGDTLATGGSSGDVIRIYYDDSTRDDATPTLAFTTDPAAPPVQSGDTHCLGVATIPASASVDGFPVRSPGYAYSSD